MAEAVGHTPGTWEVRANGVFLRVVHGEHKVTIADGVVSETNARLIAAAPDLLEASEAVLASTFAAHYRLVSPFKDLAAAIAKARGQ